MIPGYQLSDKHISLVADKISEENLRKIAIQYFDFSISELKAIIRLQKQNLQDSWLTVEEQNKGDPWLTNCGIIETWRDKDPTVHKPAVNIIIYIVLVVTLCFEWS